MPERVDEYELIRLLGHGAMGQVYQAVDTLLGRPVAVKFIAHESPSDTARERFLIEARAIARLQHPNVVSIYRVGVTQGRPYLVSELVRGQSLDSVPLPMPWTRVLNIAVQLARGLAAAHLQGVLHRDLKPGKVRSEGDNQNIVPRWGEVLATEGLRCGTTFLGSNRLLNCPWLSRWSAWICRWLGRPKSAIIPSCALALSASCLLATCPAPRVLPSCHCTMNICSSSSLILPEET